MNKEHIKSWIAFQEACDADGKTPLLRSFGLCVREFPERMGAMDDEDGDEPTKRTLAFNISTPGVKRDGHSIDSNGWHLSNFRSNPVVPWVHSRTDVPVASSQKEYLVNVPQLGGKVLRGDAQFLTAKQNPFADQIYQLYKDRVLNATSVSWDSLKYEPMRSEDGYVTGLRFLEQDLIEYSMVPLPADPQALQKTLRSGAFPLVTPDHLDVRQLLNTRSEDGRIVMYLGKDYTYEPRVIVDMKPENRMVDTDLERTVVPFSSHGKVPVADKASRWDAAGAKKRLAEWSSNGSGDKLELDSSKYKRGFLHFDADKPDNLGSYKGPHHDIVGGKFVTVPRGVYAAAQRLQQGAFDVPAGELPGMRAHLSSEYALMGEKAPWDRSTGKIYEQVLGELRSDNIDEKEREILQRQAIECASDLYGDSRLIESWEERKYECSDPIVRLFCEVLDNSIKTVVEDDDDRMSIVRNMAEGIISVMQNTKNTFINEDIQRVLEDNKITDVESLNGIFDKYREFIQNKDSETNTRTDSESVETETVEVDGSLDILRGIEEAINGKNGASLFESLLRVAGASSE